MGQGDGAGDGEGDNTHLCESLFCPGRLQCCVSDTHPRIHHCLHPDMILIETQSLFSSSLGLNLDPLASVGSLLPDTHMIGSG